jgi:hypothetical protein
MTAVSRQADNASSWTVLSKQTHSISREATERVAAQKIFVFVPTNRRFVFRDAQPPRAATRGLSADGSWITAPPDIVISCATLTWSVSPRTGLFAPRRLPIMAGFVFRDATIAQSAGAERAQPTPRVLSTALIDVDIGPEAFVC